jgi:hypothetical protein
MWLSRLEVNPSESINSINSLNRRHLGWLSRHGNHVSFFISHPSYRAISKLSFIICYDTMKLWDSKLVLLRCKQPKQWSNLKNKPVILVWRSFYLHGKISRYLFLVLFFGRCAISVDNCSFFFGMSFTK